MEQTSAGLLLALAGIGVGFFVGLFIDRMLLARAARTALAEAKFSSKKMLDEAEQKVKELHFEKVEKAEAELTNRQLEFERERAESKRSLRRAREKLEGRQEKLSRRSRRLSERESIALSATELFEEARKVARARQVEAAKVLEEALAERSQLTELKEQVLTHEEDIRRLRQNLSRKEESLEGILEEQKRKLEQVTSMSPEEARQAMIERFIDEARLEASAQLKEIRDEAKLSANREARKIILTAIQRMAASHAIENTVSVVNIQSDEMKGRIIGREGRNIRAFEAETGIEVIVDDTPEAVILSGFDPVRREVARLAMLRLIQDGRIHPTRIEEVVEKVRTDIEEEIIEVGERAIIELNINGLHPELIRMVGRMRYRTSYGQNLLAHSIETARIASLMAAELGLDTRLATRAGLLHDIGKVVEEEIEQPHALVGMELCQKYKEHPDVCNAVGAHHDEIEMTCLTAPVVQAADAISGARPGARREALESYIKRLEKLEDLAGSFDGVERVYAIQAGREVRVLVNHELVSDAAAEDMALEISKRIQDELQYPGQVKVTVIREVRSVSYAR